MKRRQLAARGAPSKDFGRELTRAAILRGANILAIPIRWSA
jgi:hypothetical protein